MKYDIKLYRHDAEKWAIGTLPFVPVKGMFLKAPWENNDYRRVDEVYFDHISGRFEVYFDKAFEDESC